MESLLRNLPRTSGDSALCLLDKNGWKDGDFIGMMMVVGWHLNVQPAPQRA